MVDKDMSLSRRLSQGVGPNSDSGEEVALAVPHKLAWYDILDGSFIDFPRRNVSRLDEFPQPFGGERVYFVVVRGHFPFPPGGRSDWSRLTSSRNRMHPSRL